MSIGYFKVTTDSDQRFDIPATYHGEQTVMELIKKEGLKEVRLMADPIKSEVDEMLNGR